MQLSFSSVVVSGVTLIPATPVVFSERLREPGRAGQHVVQQDVGRRRGDGMPTFVRHRLVSVRRQRLERLVHQLLRT